MRAIPPIVLMLLLSMQPLTAPAWGAVPIPPVLISEVHPWPVIDPAGEFVELHVPKEASGILDLRGWTLTDNDGGPELVFGRVTLEPGAYLVIWNSRRPSGQQGLTCGKRAPTWNNEGDDVTLVDPGGQVRARVIYGSGSGIDHPSNGSVGPDLPAPGKGMSIAIDPRTGRYTEAPPSLGGPSTASSDGGAPGSLANVEPGPSANSTDETRSDLGQTRSSSESVSKGPTVVIQGVHPGGDCRWEHVVLSNEGDADADISGWTLEDGEGSWWLPANTSIPRGEDIHVGTNGTAHDILWGFPLHAVVEVEGAFALADGGDDLVVRNARGEVVDQIWYGEVSGEPPEGWSGGPVDTPRTMPWGRLLLRQPVADTDAADDWAWWQEPRCGWLDPVPHGPWPAARAGCFVTPEEGLAVLAGVLSSAEERIDASLYRLTSTDLTSCLAERARAGVSVRLLVEGGPVGRSESEREREEGMLAAIVEAGAEVHLTYPLEVGVRHQPYAYDHAKYCVVDDDLAVVTTENWVTSAFPAATLGSFPGSRGWGAVIESRGLGEALIEVLDHDLRLCAEPWSPAGIPAAQLPDIDPSPPPLELFETAGVELLVGPEGLGDGLSRVCDFIGSAERSLDVQLASLEVTWGDHPSPLAGALIAAASNGVRVRVLLDPGFDASGELSARELLSLAAGAGAMGLRVAVASDIEGVSRIHVKGALADGARVLMGSMNWVRASVARSREVDVVLDSPEAVAPLSRAFEADWCASLVRAPTASPPGILDGLLSGWNPSSEDDLPPGPPQEPEPAGGFNWMAIVRVVLVVGGGLLLWEIEVRYHPLLRARTLAIRGLRRLRDRLTIVRSGPRVRGEAPRAPPSQAPPEPPLEFPQGWPGGAR
jgi:hypothetical protein